MSHSTNPRRVKDNEAMAMVRNLRTSAQKLNLLASSIRGKKVEEALRLLSFSKRRIAVDVKKLLESAVANAENNHQLDVDQLIVTEATVGKSLVMKRFRPRARGRTGKILKPFSRMKIVVGEVTEEAA
jgi:large subunit ribosomal protein L22